MSLPARRCRRTVNLGEPSAERVRELFDYDPETGWLTWRVRTSNRAKVGQRAGNVGNMGYRRVGIDGVVHLEHRIIWVWLYGVPAERDIDHRNRDRSNNRKSNLRLCTATQNIFNSKLSKRNTTGFRGVTFNRSRQKWIAQAGARGNHVSLGGYATPEEAAAAYEAFVSKLRAADDEGVPR